MFFDQDAVDEPCGFSSTGLGVTTDVNGDPYGSPPNMGAIAGSV
jgi:hypothetical protein